MAKTAAERMRLYRARKKTQAVLDLNSAKIAILEDAMGLPRSEPAKLTSYRDLALRMVDELFEARMLNGAGRRKAREIIDGWP